MFVPALAVSKANTFPSALLTASGKMPGVPGHHHLARSTRSSPSDYCVAAAVLNSKHPGQLDTADRDLTPLEKALRIGRAPAFDFKLALQLLQWQCFGRGTFDLQ